MARAPRRSSASAGAADRLELAPPEIPSGDRASAIMRVAYSHLLDDDLLTEGICECFYNALIFADAALKYDRGKDFFAFADVI